mgnify:CR=1 FL=1
MRHLYDPDGTDYRESGRAIGRKGREDDVPLIDFGAIFLPDKARRVSLVAAGVATQIDVTRAESLLAQAEQARLQQLVVQQEQEHLPLVALLKTHLQRLWLAAQALGRRWLCFRYGLAIGPTGEP